MNTFICSTERPFQFIGRINEDVNTYVSMQAKGLVFMSINQVTINQQTTQKSTGGMTELYLDSGTYVKSFYSVISQPSSLKIKLMGPVYPRLHHLVKWNHTAPMILSEEHKKKH